MYPPHASDLAIKALIQELSQGEHLPSGATLRTAMKERFGTRGGVARVYRLLSEARPKREPPAVAELNRLERELRAAREVARLAEHREEAHQTRWAMEVDQLRQRVAALEPLALQTQSALDAAELLRRQLYAAHVRITTLEQQLFEQSPR